MYHWWSFASSVQGCAYVWWLLFIHTFHSTHGAGIINVVVWSSRLGWIRALVRITRADPLFVFGPQREVVCNWFCWVHQSRAGGGGLGGCDWIHGSNWSWVGGWVGGWRCPEQQIQMLHPDEQIMSCFPSDVIYDVGCRIHSIMQTEGLGPQHIIMAHYVKSGYVITGAVQCNSSKLLTCYMRSGIVLGQCLESNPNQHIGPGLRWCHTCTAESAVNVFMASRHTQTSNLTLPIDPHLQL